MFVRPRHCVALVLSVCLSCAAAPVVAQTADHDSAHHDHVGHNHDGNPQHQHQQLEIGVAPGLVFLPFDLAFAFGLHLHVVVPLLTSSWGVGFGLERLFDEHGHTTASLVVQLRIIAGWSAIVAPGLTFEDDGGVGPSIHIETTYEFFFDSAHLGPSLEVAVDLEEIHITLGLHVAVGM